MQSGKTVNFMDENKRPATIVGVIKDYHFTSLKEKITPAVIFNGFNISNYGQVWVKINPDNTPQTLAIVGKHVQKTSALIFLTLINLWMKSMQKIMKPKQNGNRSSALHLHFLFSFHVLVCWDLLFYPIEQRTKEIGIRKVLGAAVSKDRFADFKRIHHSYFDCIYSCSAGWILFH